MIKSLGRDCLIVKTDISALSEVEDMVETAKEKYGK